MSETTASSPTVRRPSGSSPAPAPSATPEEHAGMTTPPGRMRAWRTSHPRLFSDIIWSLVGAAMGFLLIAAGYYGWVKPSWQTAILVIGVVVVYRLIKNGYKIVGVSVIATAVVVLAGFTFGWRLPNIGGGPVAWAIAIAMLAFAGVGVYALVRLINKKM